MDDTYEGTTVAWSGRGPAKPRRFWPGDVIDGRYEVRGYLGQGGMGAVLRVEDHIQGKAYALKYCLRVEADFRRFAREVRMMELVKHKNVVPVVASNLDHDPPYFLMPLAERSLESEVPRLAGSEAEVLALFRQICRGVQAIHDSGIVHRDLKPANILRFARGRVAVSDLGAAKLESRDTTVLTEARVVVGTLAFLAPEQWLPGGSRGADIRTDVYQLGKVLYQLLTGRSPVLIEPDALPEGLIHILRRATAANPDDRYPNLAELLDALRYHELSKDPAKDAREVLEVLVLRAEDSLRLGSHAPEVLRAILGVMMNLDRRDPDIAIESFDRLPDGLLPRLAVEAPGEFLPVLKGYARALRSRVARANFGYADTVARRMTLIFTAAHHPGVKTVALQTTLIAAVELNRYAAMGVFNRLLMAVKTIELALPTAEMLRAHAEYYHEVAAGAPPDRLHPAIRDVQQELLTWDNVPFRSCGTRRRTGVGRRIIMI